MTNLKKASFLTLIILIGLSFFFSQRIIGENTTKDPRDEIIGTWHQHIGKRPYKVDIKKDNSNSTGVVMNGFDDIPDDVKATISGMELIIPEQNINGEVLSGNGKISPDFSEITVNYTNDGFHFVTKKTRYIANL